MFDTTAIRQIKDGLVKQDESVSVAESVTSGLLQVALSTAEEAMRFYQGGITVYNIGQKARHLHIDPVHAITCNCVSAKMAEDMALSVCTLFTSNWGVGVTGYASPVPESDAKLFAYFAIAHNEQIALSQKIEIKDLPPFETQQYYVNTILKAMAGLL